MKKYAIIAISILFAFLAGCGSDSSECSNNEVKPDCNDGKYSLCVDGKWTETVCADNVSCTKDGACGQCHDGDIKDCANGEDNIGMVTICKDGQWSKAKVACADNVSCRQDGACGQCHDGDIKDCANGEDSIGMVTICKAGQWSDTKVACPNDFSCIADKCGECRNGDSIECENDSDMVGNAKMCKDGQWTKDATLCSGQVSCAMTEDCYSCHKKCDSDWSCPKECKDSSCESACKKNVACKDDCGECVSKCGECRNNENKNCKENSDGVGRADICINGTWNNDKKCTSIDRILVDVSCVKICPNYDNCEEEEKESFCGECKNTKAGQYICIHPYDTIYGEPGLFGEYTQLFECKDGKLNTMGVCPVVCTEDGQCD